MLPAGVSGLTLRGRMSPQCAPQARMSAGQDGLEFPVALSADSIPSSSDAAGGQHGEYILESLYSLAGCRVAQLGLAEFILAGAREAVGCPVRGPLGLAPQRPALSRILWQVFVADPGFRDLPRARLPGPVL